MEAGDVEPTRRQLVAMARQYRRPLVTFYLPEPPRQGQRGHDFRTLPAHYSPANEALVDALVRDLIARQGLVRAALEDEEDVEPVVFVASVERSDGVIAVMNAIKEGLEVDRGELWACSSPEDAFALLRSYVERAGIFVLLAGNLGSHHTNIDLEAFRGLALADPIAPFVVINDQDAPAAWTFTLVHELAHIWLGQTGISGEHVDNDVERFCNDVASEFLLPREVLESVASDGRLQNIDDAVELIQGVARTYRVSHSMVAYKLYRQRQIDVRTWESLRERFRDLWLSHKDAKRHDQRRRPRGPSYYVVRRHRLGSGLLNVTGRLLRDGSLSTSKAGRVLGVKPTKVGRLLQE